MSESMLNFSFPQPYSALLVGPGSNRIEVVLTPREDQPRRGQAIRWLAEPADVAFLSDGDLTFTGKDGVASNTLLITKPTDDLITVSVWDDSQPDAPHFTTLYQCVVARVWASVDTNIVNTTPRGVQPARVQLITATATVVDDSSAPVRGLHFYWSGTPSTPTSAYLPPALTSVRAQADGYPCVTDDRGQGALAFANTKSTILMLELNTTTSKQTLIVFTDVAQGIGVLPALIVPLNDRDVLDLDSFGGEGVPIRLDPSLGSMNNYVVIWLNGVVAAIGYPGIDYAITPLYVAKNYFKNGNASNLIGAVVSDTAGNGQDTKLTSFPATGGVPAIEPPVRLDRMLDPPELVPGSARIVNQSVLAGGLQIWIPAYELIAEGDQIHINLYLRGYFSGTAIERYGLIQLDAVVSYGDVDNGLLVVVNEANFLGYDRSSSNGAMGELQIEYIVNGRQFSLLLIRPFLYAGPGSRVSE